MTDPITRTEFPRTVREIENTWIPMPDGTRLAARIWLPADAEANPVPAVLEYLPYRKRDGTVVRDHLTHPYFAGHGYAGVRVDMRGTGDSEGVCRGEYLQQEQDDALVVLDWIAAQPWSSGKVGMMGISWGGFNGLQIAARQPEPLAAVITLCSTDDRYADDIHFMGGTILTDKLTWGATAFSIANTPPDPAIVGADRWRAMWQNRLENNGLWMLDWFRHQRRDAFWQHGSICEDYSAVTVPVYAIGGYADGYTNPVFRLMENLPGPRKALVGPWAHKYPHFANPGPQIGFLQEALRWWDQHLKGVDTGIMDEPQIRVWMQDDHAPDPGYAARPGHWAGLSAWPAPGQQTRVLHVTPGGLSDAPDADPVTLDCPETTGWTAQTWVAYGVNADGPLDQNGECGLAETFTSAPLAEDTASMGFPMLTARVASTVPQANIAAVLSSVAPDGAATFLSFGVLNLTHRDSHATPEPLPAGQPVPITVQLNVTGQTVPKGHRLRLALSQAYWPLIWPSADKAVLTLTDAVLTIPLLPADAALDLVPFDRAEGAEPAPLTEIAAPSYRRDRIIDCVTGTETTHRHDDRGTYHHGHTGLTVGVDCEERYTIHPAEPNSATGACRWQWRATRGDWLAQLDTTVSVAALATHWRIEATLIATDADGIVAERRWAEDIPRDLV